MAVAVAASAPSPSSCVCVCVPPWGEAASEAVRGVSREVCHSAVRRAVSAAMRLLAGRLEIVLEGALEMAVRACGCEGCRARRREGWGGTAGENGGIMVGEEEEEVWEDEDDMEGEQGTGERSSICVLQQIVLHLVCG